MDKIKMAQPKSGQVSGVMLVLHHGTVGRMDGLLISDCGGKGVKSLQFSFCEDAPQDQCEVPDPLLGDIALTEDCGRIRNHLMLPASEHVGSDVQSSADFRTIVLGETFERGAGLHFWTKLFP